MQLDADAVAIRAELDAIQQAVISVAVKPPQNGVEDKFHQTVTLVAEQLHRRRQTVSQQRQRGLWSEGCSAMQNSTAAVWYILVCRWCCRALVVVLVLCMVLLLVLCWWFC